MLITSRRSVIIGLTSLVAAPALVRASSLDAVLRSKTLLDPWVLVYDRYPNLPSVFARSNDPWAIPIEFVGQWWNLEQARPKWLALSEQQKANFLNEQKSWGKWYVRRESELNQDLF